MMSRSSPLKLLKIASWKRMKNKKRGERKILTDE
jgi:hypothetical protein